MINLLPYDNKAEIRAARVNVILFRYILILLAAIIVLGGLIIAAYLALNSTKQLAEEKVEENNQRLSVYQNIRTEADQFRAELSTAKSVFDSKTSYTSLIYKIANTIPENTYIQSLELDPDTLGSPMTLNVQAKTFSDGTRVREAFEQNTEVFSDVKLLSIRGGSSSSGDSSTGNTGGSSDANYPIQVSLTVTIKKEAL